MPNRQFPCARCHRMCNIWESSSHVYCVVCDLFTPFSDELPNSGAATEQNGFRHIANPAGNWGASTRPVNCSICNRQMGRVPANTSSDYIEICQTCEEHHECLRTLLQLHQSGAISANELRQRLEYGITNSPAIVNEPEERRRQFQIETWPIRRVSNGLSHAIDCHYCDRQIEAGASYYLEVIDFDLNVEAPVCSACARLYGYDEVAHNRPQTPERSSTPVTSAPTPTFPLKSRRKIEVE